MANLVRERMNGQFTYYNINRHIDYTNVCETTWKFCAFSRFEGEEGSLSSLTSRSWKRGNRP